MRFPNEESWVMKKPDECVCACCKGRHMIKTIKLKFWKTLHIIYPKKTMIMYSVRAPASPEEQLSVGQRYAAVPHSPWTPSWLVWTARCCRTKDNIQLCKYSCNGPFFSSKDLWSAPLLPGSRCVHGLILDQASPLPLQLSQDSHPGLAVWKDCIAGKIESGVEEIYF